MTTSRHHGTTLLSRREAIGRVAGSGLGILSVLRTTENVGLASAWSLQGSAVASRTSAPSATPTWKTEFRQIAPNVYAFQQAGGPGIPSSGVSNGGCIVGPDHWMAIDAFAAPPHAKAMIAAANKATGKPCRRLVNTHHHADHTTGNCFFLPAEIVASEYCRQSVIRGGIADLSRRPASWRVGEAELKLAPPVVTFDDRMTYHYGDTVVELISAAPAHTYGDVLVYLPQYRILFAGDIAFHYTAPAGQSAHISKWIEAIDRINTMDVDIIVPGHGPIGTKKDLAEMRQYLDMIKREARRRYDVGMTPGKAAAEIEVAMRAYDDWVDPAANRVPASTARLYAEFKGILTPEHDGGDAVGALMRETNEEYNRIKAGSR